MYMYICIYTHIYIYIYMASWATSSWWCSGISRIGCSPFYEPFVDSSRNVWFKKICILVPSNWGPLTVSFKRYRWSPLGVRAEANPPGEPAAVRQGDPTRTKQHKLYNYTAVKQSMCRFNRQTK